MKKPPRRRVPLSRQVLIGLSVLFAITAVGLLVIVLFNVQPYMNVPRGRLGFLDYRQGIPVGARTSLKIADTSITTYYRNGPSFASLAPDHNVDARSVLDKRLLPEKRDSIFAHYKLFSLYGEANKDVTINGIEVDHAKFFLQTKKVVYKLYYTYPVIVNCIVASYCFWLLAQFVSAIQKGWSFTKKNRVRLQKVGWSILALQAAYFIVELMPPLINYFDVSYTATIPGYRSNFDLRAIPVRPFSITWSFIGLVILVVARAFKDGEMLQEDKDLTI